MQYICTNNRAFKSRLEVILYNIIIVHEKLICFFYLSVKFINLYYYY